MKKLIGERASWKKATATLVAVAVVFLLDLIGYDDPETIENIKQLVIAYILGQGVADFGKGAKQIKE